MYLHVDSMIHFIEFRMSFSSLKISPVWPPFWPTNIDIFEATARQSCHHRTTSAAIDRPVGRVPSLARGERNNNICGLRVDEVHVKFFVFVGQLLIIHWPNLPRNHVSV